jgi:hypothetical protein
MAFSRLMVFRIGSAAPVQTVPMTTRIIIQLLLLPLVLLAVPLMFSLAWVQEALSDLAP